jgi:hypothetical protein
MKCKRLFVGLALFLTLILPAIAPAQNLGNLVRERALVVLRFWAVQSSVISQDGTFVKLFRQGASTDPNSTTSNDAVASWSFQESLLAGRLMIWHSRVFLPSLLLVKVMTCLWPSLIRQHGRTVSQGSSRLMPRPNYTSSPALMTTRL